MQVPLEVQETETWRSEMTNQVHILSLLFFFLFVKVIHVHCGIFENTK